VSREGVGGVKPKRKPHTLAFGARVSVGVKRERRRWEPERKPPRTRVWGEGEGGR
jgi:hypothetical protein